MKLRLDVFKVWKEATPQQSSDILKEHQLRPEITDQRQRRRKHVSRVIHPGMDAAEGERLTWRSASHQIKLSMTEFRSEIKVPHIRQVDRSHLPRRNGAVSCLPEGGIVPESRACLWLELDQRGMLKPGGMKT